MTNKLIQWIVMNQHPFTLVEEPYFIELVHSLHPAAEIISADTLKRKLIDLYETNLEKIKKILEETPGKISFTTDIWTSPSRGLHLSKFRNPARPGLKILHQMPARTQPGSV